MGNENRLLTARNISKSFGKAVIALDRVQFDLRIVGGKRRGKIDVN